MFLLLIHIHGISLGYLSGGQFLRGNHSGVIVWGAKLSWGGFHRGYLSGGKLSKGKLFGGNCLGDKSSGGNCRGGQLSRGELSLTH